MLTFYLALWCALLFQGGTLVSIVRGVNGPLLQKTMLELVDQEKKKQELGSKYVPEVRGS